ncbi:MAG: DNA mismatch repair endonuclease MutL, partial [Oscillospiraceae bacterium]|nr:DNA mismatch repair endonuclease MutL [Oscillospiraceae bacterium]
MPHIQVLPPYVADLIAAGEVVERPASVVKELCENALDAGATTVTVEISGGGVRSLRVTDNGCGIAREEVKTAFLPHATSKIGTAEDLDHIGTMGFRGEALPSIAAVARVQLLTRTADADVGTCCEIHCGKEVTLADAGCPVGTTVVVRDLFCRTPARMKFLKKDATEGGYVGAVLERIALSRPEVAFAFIREGKRVFQTPGDGSAGSAVRAVLGKAFYDGMLGTKNAHNGIEVTGFVCQPEAARPNRSQQYFFLNGRWIKCPTASAALGEAYKRSIMAGKFPACVLYITVPTGLVDVNVHPAKTEVRFADERPVFSAVYQSAYGALHTESKRERDALPVRAPVFASAPAAPLSSDPLSPASQMPACQLAILLRDTADGNPLIEEEAPQLLRKTIPQAAQTPVRRPTEAMPEETPPRDVRVVGEVFRTYILCERGGELLLI